MNRYPWAKPERNKTIIEAVKRNRTFKEIGEFYSISRQRVQQIAKKEGLFKKPKVVDNTNNKNK
jgi:DNA-directed RNA polymerase sigma subunit (sigma70/sigma32)